MATKKTPKATSPALDRVQAALEAAQAYPEGQHPPEVLNELADALQAAPESYRQHPGMDEWMQWAQNHTERRQHAQFFELLKQLDGMDADTPEHTELFMQAMRCAPKQYMDAAMQATEEFLPQATHVNEQGQPVYSVQEIAQHFGKTEEEVQDDVQRLIDDGHMDARSQGYAQSAYPLQ